MSFRYVGLLSPALFVVVTGCQTLPPQTGFLSDYSRLEKVGQAEMRFISPDLRECDAFIVDPLQFQIQRDPPVLTKEQKAEVANYFRTTFERTLTEHDYKVVKDAGSHVGRLRVALTDVKKSTWWLNLWWGTKLAGAGTGGASMEAEIVDSVTGEQLAAVIKAGKGNQFELDYFKALDDIKDVIDRWAKEAGKRLDELHGKENR